MTARLDHLLQRLGQDVVVQPAVTVLRTGGDRRLRAVGAAEVTDLYERHVFSALKTVSPAERECIELTYFDGLGAKEIAIRCGMSIEAVEDRLRRGLESMLGNLRAREEDRSPQAGRTSG
jgi:DNA-directed RNA polymerase specialized sigma24 family protein